jgi:phosphoglycerate dehydrogenase-like enzyme
MSEVLTAMGAQVVGVELGDDVAAALPNADAVTLHCSLTPTSVGLMSASMLDLLPNHAVVVNTARGGSLDVEAAVARVAEGRLRGVCVDVFPEEPYSRLAEGAAVPGVWFTPHSSGYTAGLGERVAAGVRSTLEAWLGDLPLPHRVL